MSMVMTWTSEDVLVWMFGMLAMQSIAFALILRRFGCAWVKTMITARDGQDATGPDYDEDDVSNIGPEWDTVDMVEGCRKHSLTLINVLKEGNEPTEQEVYDELEVADPVVQKRIHNQIVNLEKFGLVKISNFGIEWLGGQKKDGAKVQ